MSFARSYKNLKAKLGIVPGEDAKKADKEIAELYRAVFGSDRGRQVLTHMLAELHFFDEAVGVEETVLSNYARHLLSILGVWRAVNAEEIVRGLMAVDWRKPYSTEETDQ